MKIELHHLGEAHNSMIPNTPVPLKQHVIMIRVLHRSHVPTVEN